MRCEYFCYVCIILTLETPVPEVRVTALGNSHFIQSLPVTSNLLHWTVALIYDYLHRR